ncbi:Hypothetical protein FKW44_004385 [Caligus rogercresseyi]|uniref:Uncharacterized protein n=1 Tax=Caligus rogercresseyi TaxID=217165 RepID=A0A7T8HLU9_CALRO|nr:Hypothetical protein FKW44_004385 [Caligus rogercresseyi]
MQNELNINKYFKLTYSANRCRCAVKSSAGSVFLSKFPSRGTLPRPSTPPSREKSASEGS